MENYVYLLTKNPGKINAAKSVFSMYSIQIKTCDFNIHEIQANTSLEIATNAVKKAFEKLHEPVIREDHSFFIDELGIPGPYMAYIEKQIDINHLIKILNTLDMRTGHWTVGTSFIDKCGNLHEFTYDIPIVFELEPRGKDTKSWDQLIRFPDETRVFSEYPEEERLSVWNKNFEKIAKLMKDFK